MVVDAKAQVRTLPAATPWLATAGSGDVLAGLMGGLLALNVRAGAGHVGTTVASAAALAPAIAQLAARLHALAGQLAAEATGPKPAEVTAPKASGATGPKSAGAVVAHPITAPEIAAAIAKAWALYASAAAN